VRPLQSSDGDVKESEVIESAVAQRRGWISPGLSVLLIGGVALGGIVCMCLGVLLLAFWKGV
jgi:hypothetical protein